jgi:hypothetical protein
MSPQDLARIRTEAKASAVLSLQHDDCLRHWSIDFPGLMSAARRSGMTLTRYPIRDFDVEDMRRQLPGAIALLAHLQSGGHRTYVHCTAGLGRAPLTVLGFLTLVEGLDAERVIRLILAGRPGAVPAWEAYHHCVEDLVARHRSTIERRAYELYQARVHDDPDADWSQARAEVLRGELIGMSSQLTASEG